MYCPFLFSNKTSITILNKIPLLLKTNSFNILPEQSVLSPSGSYHETPLVTARVVIGQRRKT